ncbi:bifunctional helix-turn-helix transcriptional regulator/GNAT family N-acetyltransferase [Candidatus Uabimicrobium amorphum]|uniref:MarR family transcriptional regulator n=1 Tax=Uabimicrobium amorphum TaxID=2596890 RepID=A0A5S9F295_UABAM|nr:bifunctional helix-turn-helix transcriptional regulator/GNAT family N-acetyltransferase [Candidatus Uabimicrobium amorphum]BBM83011.1 MarR family transcriptional regulator [Candidatus Uabimicrobium amorphum]
MDIMNELHVLALGSRLKRLSDCIMQDVTTIYKKQNVDFEPRWFTCFYTLYHYSPIAVTEISKKLGVSHVAVNHMLKGLQKKDLICSQTGKKDKRKRMISLTEKGKQLYPKLQPIWRNLESSVHKYIMEIEYDVIDVLKRMEESMAQKGLVERFCEEEKQSQLDSVNIIDYKAQHKDYFRDINLRWIEKYFHVEDLDYQVLTNPETEILKCGGHIFMAEYNGEIVGTCALLKESEDCFELAKMGVDEKAQGKQIGKKLALAAIDRARELGAKAVVLETNSKLIPATNLYRRLGFVMDMNKQGHYQRGDVMMRLEL